MDIRRLKASGLDSSRRRSGIGGAALCGVNMPSAETSVDASGLGDRDSTVSWLLPRCWSSRTVSLPSSQVSQSRSPRGHLLCEVLKDPAQRGYGVRVPQILWVLVRLSSSHSSRIRLSSSIMLCSRSRSAIARILACPNRPGQTSAHAAEPELSRSACGSQILNRRQKAPWRLRLVPIWRVSPALAVGEHKVRTEPPTYWSQVLHRRTAAIDLERWFDRRLWGLVWWRWTSDR
jgi:hypothetical protein